MTGFSTAETNWSPAAPTRFACQVSSAATASASSVVNVASSAAPARFSASKMAAAAKRASASFAVTAAKPAVMATCAPPPTAHARMASAK